jgi:integrase
MAGGNIERSGIKLTKTFVDAARYDRIPTSNAKGEKVCPPVIFWDSALLGFGLRAYSSGKKSYVLSYRHKGRKHLMCLGPHGVLTLDQARDRARKELAKILDQCDPLDERQNTGITFKDFTEQYIERHAKQHKKTWYEDLRRCENYLLPKFGSYRIDAITRGEVARFHGELGQKYPYAANRVLEQLSKMFELARLWGYLPETQSNPARNIKAFREVKRDRWVTPEELPKLAQALNEESNFYGRQAIWLYLLLGVRRDELLKAKWMDIDWSRKELRLPETKTGKVHYIPLSTPALAILKNLPQVDGNPHILPGSDGKHLVAIERIWDRVRKAAGVPDVRLHDLRRTVGSWLAQSGNSLHLIGRVLNHSSQATTAIYARFAQDNVRQAMEDHSAKLMSVAGINAPVRMPLARRIAPAEYADGGKG